MEKTNVTDRLCRSVIDTRFEDLSESNIENAKHRILDVLGCIAAGANAECNPELVRLVRDWGGKEESSILIYGGKTVAHNAALVNSVMARSFDFESLGPLVDGKCMPAHISGTTVVAALAMAETYKISGKDMITALLSGDNLTSRIIAAESTGGLPPGWDSVGTANSFGSAAIASKIMGLDMLQLKNALGLVFNQMSGSMQNIWDGVPAFKLLQGLSARNGIISAQLAKAGWAGPDDPLFGRQSYFNLFAGGCGNPDILVKDLGKKYYHDAHFKIHPCCAVSHAAVDCAVSIAANAEFDYNDIKKITLRVSTSGLNSFLAQPFEPVDFPHAKAAFNYRYLVAAALKNKSLRPEDFTDNSINDPEVHSLIGKTELAQLPGVERELLCAGLTVTMKSGDKFEKLVTAPKGEPLANPLSKDEIVEKFYSNLEYSGKFSPEKSNKLLSLLDRLEELEDITGIIELLTS